MSRGRVATLACVLSLAGLSAPVEAAPAGAGGWVAPPPTTTVEPLVIVAKPLPLQDAALDRAVSAVVATRVAPTRVDRIARWGQPICPETVGLPDDIAAEVTARVLQIGAAVGAPARPAKTCLANIEIVFTPFPQPFMDRIRQRRWVMLGYHYVSQAAALAAVTRPIQGWWVTGTRSTANSAQSSLLFAAAPTGASQLAIDDPQSLAPSGAGSGRFDTSLTSELANALIVVDQSKLAGAATATVSDYAAMLALAHLSHPPVCGPLPSILDLFASCGRPAPESLTASDLAYLKALYATNLALPAAVARGQIAAKMEAALRRRS